VNARRLSHFILFYFGSKSVEGSDT